ncbi:MAG: alpha/beta hydrolase [Bacilli bacterium]|jgi:acetyl esterase/lipase|nr:alpha/beta hydrolase [Bacilli bacterium]
MAPIVSDAWNKKYQIADELKDYARFMTLGSIKITPVKIALSNTGAAITTQAPVLDLRVRTIKKRIRSYDGKTIRLTIYEPKNIEKEKAPAILYLHGGGFMIREASHHHKVSRDYADGAKAKVIFVHYRLAPKYSFPYPVEDCYSALLWVCRNAKRLGIDKNRIAVAGDSAGGGLAAAMTHMSRDRSGPKICFQMLIYPALDHRQKTASIKKYFDAPGWNSLLNKQMWKIYLQDGHFGMLSYASPSVSTCFENLPPAYIEPSQYDCLRDEAIEYAKKLENNGIKVELNYIEGAFHAFDIMQGKKLVQKVMSKRISALSRAFRLVK